MAQPDGRDFAVFLQQVPTDSIQHPSVNLVIVHADGTSTAIPGHFVHL
ncbi:MAG: hypothetical protein ACREOM_04075 [Candidatus Dormibacteraceae bacterium]